MLALSYKIWSPGAERTAGNSRIVKFDVGLKAIAKRHRDSPYEVFNELVCMHLGRILGLPVPIGFVIENSGSQYYCSAESAIFDGEPPDADFEEFAQNDPRMAIGVVVFDAWIGNVDRHSRNAIYDIEDKRIYLIDHGSALLGESGVETIKARAGKIELCEDLTHEITDVSHFRAWYTRLMEVPDWLITSTTREAAKIGIDENEAQEAASFLIDRRYHLLELFENQRSQLFPHLDRTLWSSFRYDNDSPDYSI